MSASLTYYIFEGILVGFVAGELVHIPALSGGRGGSTSKGAGTDAVNNPYMTGLETTYHKDPKTGKLVHGEHDTHGGPIPVDRYRIAAPALHTGANGHKFMAAVLTSTSPHRHHRGGFLIHGTGHHGSDGCIVPLNKSSFDRLMNLLKKDGGGSLQVLQAMDAVFV